MRTLIAIKESYLIISKWALRNNERLHACVCLCLCLWGAGDREHCKRRSSALFSSLSSSSFIFSLDNKLILCQMEQRNYMPYVWKIDFFKYVPFPSSWYCVISITSRFNQFQKIPTTSIQSIFFLYDKILIFRFKSI